MPKSKPLDTVVQTEELLLASMMHKPELAFITEDIVRSEHFVTNQHKIIYAAILDNCAKGTLIATEVMQQANLSPEHVMRLLDIGHAMSESEAKTYARQVRKYSILRDAQRLGDEIKTAASVDILKDYWIEIGRILDTTDDRPFSHVKKDIMPVLQKVRSLSKGEISPPLLTGYREFDEATAGLGQGDLLIFGAYTSIGKTTFALDIAWNISASHPVGFMSVEMSRDPMYFKLLTLASGVYPEKLRRGTISQEDWKLLSTAKEVIEQRDLVFDFHSFELNQLLLRARRMKAEYNISLLVVDHCQHILSTAGDNREQQVAAIPKQLKLLAKDLEIPVFLLAQLNRKSIDRKHREPELSELRESGVLEQIADFVLLAWRVEGDNTHFKMAKNRHSGKTLRWELGFNRQTMRYENLYTDQGVAY